MHKRREGLASTPLLDVAKGEAEQIGIGKGERE